MGSAPFPLLHGLSAHTQYGAAEVLNLWVFQHLELTDRHADGKPYAMGWFWLTGLDLAQVLDLVNILLPISLLRIFSSLLPNGSMTFRMG